MEFSLEVNEAFTSFVRGNANKVTKLENLFRELLQYVNSDVRILNKQFYNF